VGCNYHYEEGNNWKNGTWDASGTAEGYIRTVITVDNLLRVQINWGFLNHYDYNEGEGSQLVVEMPSEAGTTPITFSPLGE
jgi:hypothetical protein